MRIGSEVVRPMMNSLEGMPVHVRQLAQMFRKHGQKQNQSTKKLGVMLGLGENFFVDANGNAVDITRADFSYEEIVNGNLRMPRGNEAGANEAWIPGGYLPERIPEAVLNTHPDAGRGDPSAGGTWGSYTPFRL